MTMTELDWMVDAYLRQIEGSLARLPTSRRAQIVAEISEHIQQARSELATQDEESIRDLLKRVGTVGDIAASALAEGTPDSRPRAMRERRVPLAVGGVALMILIGVVAYLAQSGSSAITMPNVIGKSPGAAESILASAGIKQVNVELLPSLAPANTVFRANFKIGSVVVVEPGKSVNLQVSTGPSVMPALAGTAANRAGTQLGRLVLHWAVVRVHSDRFAVGDVVAESPARGTKLEKQSWVELYVSSTSSPPPTLMPYVGFMEPAPFAIAELRSLGLTVRVRYFTRPGYEPGWVIGSTTPGTRLTSSGAYLAVERGTSR